MFNKYFTHEKIQTKIFIRFRISFRVTSPEDEDLSDDLYANWRNICHRDGGVASGFVYDVLKRHIPTLTESSSFYWNSKYIDDCIEIGIENISIPVPEITKCRVPGCPYSNYFGICRNCENIGDPDQKSIEEHKKLCDSFVKEVRACEQLPFLTGNGKLDGYISDVGEVEATITSF